MFALLFFVLLLIFILFFVLFFFRLINHGASSPAYTNSGLLIGTNGGNIRVFIGIGLVDAALNCSTPITTNSNHHIAVVRSGTAVTVYFDGAQEVTKNDHINSLGFTFDIFLL
jgi:hypothetical protein